MSYSFSVIVSTFNSELWLHKVLIGFNNQTYKDFELIVADDGSNHKTRDLIEKIKPFISPLTNQRSQTPLPPTPEVNPASVASRNMSPTGLTRTENALLSNQEKEIKLRSKGMA